MSVLTFSFLHFVLFLSFNLSLIFYLRDHYNIIITTKVRKNIIKLKYMKSIIIIAYNNYSYFIPF